MKKDESENRREPLRRRAEDIAKASREDSLFRGRTPEALIEELRIHQIELETQNSELIRSQAEAKSLNERFQDLFDFAPVPYFLLDSRGAIRDVNLTAAAFFGVPRSDLRGSPLTAFLSRQAFKDFTSYLARVLIATEVVTFEVEVIRKGEEPCRVLIEGISLGGEEKEIRIAIIDITERRELEDRIGVLNDELSIKAAKLEAANLDLQAFVRAVSHDLRNPIVKIASATHIVASESERLTDGGRAMLAEIEKTCYDMDDMIEGLMDLSKSAWGPFRLRKADLGRIATDIAVELGAKEPSRNVVFEISEHLWAVCDGTLMTVVLANLLGNAWKFTSTRERGRIVFGVERDGAEEVFFVRDNGVGFDMTSADSLFVAFERLESASHFAGHGIGLETTRRIIERHGGRIWARAGLDRGATFYFTLPPPRSDGGSATGDQ